MAFPTPRPEVFEVVQAGIESTKGTVVPATFRYSSMMFDVDPKKPTTEVMQAGNLFGVDSVPGKGHTEFSAKGEAAVCDLISAFSTLLSIPTFTPSGIAAATALFTPTSLASNPKNTLTFEKGQSGDGNASIAAYGAFQNLELDFVPDKTVSLTAKGIGQQYAFGNTLTADVTQLPISVLFPTAVDVYLALSEEGLADGLIYPLSCKWKMDKFLGDVYALNSANNSYETLVEVHPDVEFDLVLPKDSTSEAFVSSIDTSTQYFIEVIAQGAEIEAGITNKLRVRAPVKFMNPGEGANQDIHTITVQARAKHTDTFNTTGGALLIECTSLLTSL